jgi:hypothetical protein
VKAKVVATIVPIVKVKVVAPIVKAKEVATITPTINVEVTEKKRRVKLPKLKMSVDCHGLPSGDLQKSFDGRVNFYFFFHVSHNNKNDLSHILILCLIEILLYTFMIYCN